MKTIRAGLGMALLCAALPVAALEVQGVKLPDKASVGGGELVLNGGGLRTKVVFKVYVASLYLPQAAKDTPAVLAQAPRRIRLDLVRTLSGDQFVDALQDGLRDNNSEAELAAIKAGVDQMTSVMKGFGEVKEGSVVTLDFFDGATHIVLDGKERAAIAGEPFAKALARIWLGDKPVQADLKRALLGG